MRFVSQIALLFTALIAAGPVWAQGQLTTLEKLSFTRQLEDDLLKTAKANAALSSGDAIEAILNLTTEFDEAKLRQDENTFYQQYRKAKQQQVQEIIAQTESVGEGAKFVESNGVRLGRLNLDLNQENVQDVLSTADTSDGRQVSLNLSVGGSEPPFSYDLTKYLKSVSGVLVLAHNSTEETGKLIAAELAKELEKLGHKPKAGWLEVKQRPAPSPKTAPTVGDWFGAMFAPQNNALVILLSCLLIGVFMIVATMMLAKGFGQLALSIGDLKPAEENNDDGEAAAAAMVEEAPIEEVVEEGRFDKGASVTALTSEMRTIRDQLAELIAGNTAIVGELLADMFYEKSGLQDLRELLSFMGYTSLKPCMDLLPKRAMANLRLYIEESREEPVNLLVGVEVAQRIYRDCVSKVTDAGGDDGVVTEFRKKLIATENSVLDSIISDLQAIEIGLIIKYMSYERSTVFMRSLNPEVLKSATATLDDAAEDLPATLQGIIKRIDDADDDQGADDGLQERFILRLAQQSGVEDGDAVISLVTPEDAALKLKVLQKRFFTNYLKFLPEDYIRKSINRIDLKSRSEFLFLMDEDTRNALLVVYPEGSKLRTMVDNEMELIQNNEDIQKAIHKNRAAIINRCMGVMTKRLELDVLRQTIASEFAANSLNLPEGFINDGLVPAGESAEAAVGAA